jgi:hypothetical protein
MAECTKDNKRKLSMSDGSEAHEVSETSGAAQCQDNQEITSTREMTEEERKLEEKRAYNRRNAARARKRTKDQLAELCRKVELLSDKNKTLEGKNEELVRAVASLTDENSILRRLIIDRNAASSSASTMPQFGMGNVLGNLPVQSSTQSFDVFAGWK